MYAPLLQGMEQETKPEKLDAIFEQATETISELVYAYFDAVKKFHQDAIEHHSPLSKQTSTHKRK
jgi:hypothetical protein